MAATRYIEILAAQSPFDIGVDEYNRTRFSVNFNCRIAAPCVAFEREICRIITDAGLAVLGANLLIGGAATIPPPAAGDSNDLCYVLVKGTGGFGIETTHDDASIELLSCQVVTFAADYDISANKCRAIWRLLDNVDNLTVEAAA